MNNGNDDLELGSSNRTIARRHRTNGTITSNAMYHDDDDDGNITTTNSSRIGRSKQRYQDFSYIMIYKYLWKHITTVIMCMVLILLYSIRTIQSRWDDPTTSNSRLDVHPTVSHHHKLDIQKLNPNNRNNLHHQTVPINEFPTLRNITNSLTMHHNQKNHGVAIIGLYFAASWCPMSTPITKLLNVTFYDILTNHQQLHRQDKTKSLFSIVYVSSDYDIESYTKYIQPGWKTIPYDNIIERSNIKRYFHTCAKREMDDLHIQDRWYEIPNLIIISNGTIITYQGKRDVQKYGSNAISYWIEQLQQQTIMTL